MKRLVLTVAVLVGAMVAQEEARAPRPAEREAVPPRERVDRSAQREALRERLRMRLQEMQESGRQGAPRPDRAERGRGQGQGDRRPGTHPRPQPRQEPGRPAPRQDGDRGLEGSRQHRKQEMLLEQQARLLHRLHALRARLRMLQESRNGERGGDAGPRRMAAPPERRDLPGRPPRGGIRI